MPQPLLQKLEALLQAKPQLVNELFLKAKAESDYKASGNFALLNSKFSDAVEKIAKDLLEDTEFSIAANHHPRQHRDRATNEMALGNRDELNRGHQSHPTAKFDEAAANNPSNRPTANNKASDSLLTANDLDRDGNLKDFKDMRDRLENALRHRLTPAPAPGRSKPRPDNM